MDFRAVAALLSDGRAPLAVLAHDLGLRLTNTALDRLLGEDGAQSSLESLQRILTVPELGLLVARARDEGAVGGMLPVVAAHGTRVELAVEVTAVGSGEHTAVVLVVRSAFEHRGTGETWETPTGEALEYVVGAELGDFGRLRRVVVDGGIRHYWTADAPHCHAFLRGAPARCSDCPVFSGARAPRGITVRRGDERGTHDVVQSEPSERGVRLWTRRITSAELGSIGAFELRASSDTWRLTAIERDVVTRLAAGASLADAASALGLSVASVRMHRASVLRKARSEDRGSLLRVLL